ncbi:MAG: hypothetical protein FJZ58_04580 [Chlamydiae bacterium]|nr:hypothetical protein [Chlamydiota bacterium]
MQTIQTTQKNFFNLTTMDLIHTVGTLSRLERLYMALPSDTAKRHETLQELGKIWARAETIKKIEDRVVRRLEKLDQANCPLKVSELYKSIIQQENALQFVNSFRKDVLSVQVAPIRDSGMGAFGPTLLLRYNRPARGSSEDWIRKGVIKWTGPEEALSSEWMRSCLVAPGLMVPQSSIYHIEKGLLVRNDHQSQLSLEETAYMDKHLTLIRQCASQKTPAGKLVLFSERVAGVNFYDGAFMEWTEFFNSQKQWVFRQLGRMTFLDLLLGNIDRIVRYYEGTMLWQAAIESNLGNVMMTSSAFLHEEEMPTVYAIDNGLAKRFLYGSGAEGERKQYQTCLRDAGLKESREAAFAKQALKSIRCSFNKVEGNPLLQEELFADLALEESQQSFIQGMLEQKQEMLVQDSQVIASSLKTKYSILGDDVLTKILAFVQENAAILLA